MKPVFLKPVFIALAGAALAAGCTTQGQHGGGVGTGRAPIAPQPQSCEGLSEAACNANSSCEASYDVWTCPECDPQPGATCPKCAAPQTVTYTGCHTKVQPTEPCAGLTEAACNASSTCRANYGEVCPMCTPGSPCPPCGVTFLGCSPDLPPNDPCAGRSEDQCISPFCRPIYSSMVFTYCDANADAGGACPKDLYVGCEASQRSCLTNCDCDVNEYCHMDPIPPEAQPATVDGGVARCMAAPTGICRKVPGTYVEPDPVLDAGWGWGGGGGGGWGTGGGGGSGYGGGGGWGVDDGGWAGGGGGGGSGGDEDAGSAGGGGGGWWP